MDQQLQDHEGEQPATSGDFSLRRRTPSEILEYIADQLRPLAADLPVKPALKLDGCILSLHVLADELKRDGK